MNFDVENEHALWACSAGFTPRQVIAAVGLRWPKWQNPDWHDAVAALHWARVRMGLAA
jgi:hypothetical protein